MRAGAERLCDNGCSARRGDAAFSVWSKQCAGRTLMPARKDRGAIRDSLAVDQHDFPHWPAAGALDADEQLDPSRPTAAAVVAHARDDVVTDGQRGNRDDCDTRRRLWAGWNDRMSRPGGQGCHPVFYSMLGTQPVVLSASQVRADARAMTASATANAAQSSRPSRSR